jgi:hypothetical protein
MSRLVAVVMTPNPPMIRVGAKHVLVFEDHLDLPRPPEQSREQASDRARACIRRLGAELLTKDPDLLLVIDVDHGELFRSVRAQVAVSTCTLPREGNKLTRKSEPRKGHGWISDQKPDDSNLAEAIDVASTMVSGLLHRGIEAGRIGTPISDYESDFAYKDVPIWLLGNRSVELIPIIYNPAIALDQLGSAKSFDLGILLAQVPSEIPGERRIAIVGLAGPSEVVVDLDFNETVLGALFRGDAQSLRCVPSSSLTELHNWLTIAGAAHSLRPRWAEYLPFFSNEGGTDRALTFGMWS